MRYKVTKQYARGAEIAAGSFGEISDAKLFIQAKLANDETLKVIVVYRLYELGDMIEEFNPGDTGSGSGSRAPISSGGAQQSSTQTFNPTPFNSAPRPGGIPHSWLKDKAKDKEKDK